MMKNKIFVGLITSFLLFGCTLAQQGSGDSQIKQHLKKEITKNIEVNYLLYLPEGYETAEKWPLILFLHGSGERGDDVEKVKVHGPPKLIANGKNFPFMVVSPQSPNYESWDTDVLDALLNDVSKSYSVDEDRIYVTGLSRGGMGTWDLAAKYPDRFAAIAPVCGRGDVQTTELLIKLPVWVFHGAKDNVIPLSESQKMVDALKKLGGNVKFTIYPDATHDSWTETYNNPELYNWFLSQTRK